MSASDQKQIRRDDLSVTGHRVNLRPVPGLQLSHTQKKIGPIGRKKQLGNELRSRKSRSIVAAHKTETGSTNQRSKPDTKYTEYKNKNIKDHDKNNAIKEANPDELDDVTGFPQESSWLRLYGMTPGNSNSRHLIQTARKIRILSQLHSSKTNINELDEDGFSALHIAAQCNKVGVMEDLILHGAAVDIQASLDDATPLHTAVKYNCVNAVQLLLRHGANIMATLSNGHTPLHISCRKGHMDMCKIEHGAQIRSKDINDVTPLIQAAQCGFKDVIQCLLSMASQVGILLCEYIRDVDNEGNTALHLAVSNRHINVAKALIDRGAPICYRKANGFTPLHQAAIFGEPGMAEMLIDRGAETEVFDNEQMTPLHRAALYNNVDVILLLIRQGLFLDARDEDNFTPLLCAAWKGQTDAARSLLRYGADIQAVDLGLKSCLHWAVEMQHIEFAQMLFEHGHGGDEIVNFRDRDEQTSLHYAAEVGNVQSIKLLLEHSAKVYVTDIEKKTPLHIASQSGHLECVKVLLESCLIPLNDDDIDDMTPFLLASKNGHAHVVKYLIRKGADMSKRNDDRRSPLALAASQHEVMVMTILLDNNADVNALDKDKFPLDVAIENRQECVAKAILSSRFWQIAMNNRDSYDHTPMLRLIQFVPEAAMQVMDQCVIKSHEDHLHADLQITYDFSYVDPGPDDPSSLKIGRSFALETMVDCGREKLLAHELSQSILAKKWSKFAGWLNCIDLLLYIGFLTAIICYLEISRKLAHQSVQDNNGCPVVPLNHTFVNTKFDDIESDVRSTDFADWNRIVTNELVGLQFYLLFFVLWKIIEEFNDLFWQKWSYFTNFENWMQWTLYISVLGFVLPPYYPPCDINWPFGAMAIFVAWMNFIFILQRVDYFGLYVTMFFTTLKSLLKAMVVYSFFIIGFALSFYICFVNTDPSFRDAWQSILTTFVMTLGEINKSDIFDSGQNLHPFNEVSHIVFVAFLFLMPMVLINLTIGISVGDIEAILQTSYIQRYSLQTEMIFGMEKRFPTFIQRKLWQRKYSFFPNKQDQTMWRRIKLFLLGRTGRKSSNFINVNKVESSTIDDVMAEVSRHEKTLSNLSVIIQRQNAILRRLVEKHDIKAEL